ncbi:thioredoxin [Luteimonas terricola]|uniref:Thioredoxin n=1 Tax=Luteimonas terricola TaxID=645597 RepID=A0ABQ2ED30_9GAMM|nr:thioredoxin [Luteimonas terricola]GGK07365.1 co-chaperone YbbN [Luteimonas terricola]
MSPEHATPHVFDATADSFEAQVLDRSLQVPVLVDFWAEWCGPCKTLGPILEKLAAEYNGAFVLAKIDVDREQQLAGAFQIRSIPTVILVKDGQPVDGFPGVVPEGQLREFLAGHGIAPADAPADAEADAEAEPVAPADPHAEVQRLRRESEAAPDDDGLKLDLAVALLATGVTDEAGRLLDALPANLATDDRALRAHAALGFAALLRDAPQAPVLEAAIASDPGDLRARHLLGAHHMVAGRHEAALKEFMEMLRHDRGFDNGLPRKALIEAFRVIDDGDLVSRYRRQMSSLLLS